MPRSVNSVAKRARRKKIMKQAKGFFGRRKNVWTVAKNAVEKAMLYAYRDRKQNKRNFRALWIQRINAGARLEGMSYSQFIGNPFELDSSLLLSSGRHGEVCKRQYHTTLRHRYL
jgi:large subunit ribosomal protein L20